MKLLIRDALVVDPQSATVARRSLLVEGSKIARIGGAELSGSTIFEAGSKMLLPGFVNAHTHSHASLRKGVADRWTLEASLTNAAWMAGLRTPDEIYVSALLAAAEMLRGGCTACYDLVYEYPLPSVAGFFTVARAYADAGLRAVLAPMVADLSLFSAIPGLRDALPAPLQAELPADPDGCKILAVLEEIAVRRDELPEGIELALAPTIPHHCSENFLIRCAQLARRHGLRLHMHVAESRLQALVARQKWGCSPVEYLDQLGLLDENFTLAHGVWLDDADLDVLAARSCNIAHVPASNLRLGSGIAPLSAMLARGLKTGLGTDGANSSDALSMLTAMRLSSGGARAYSAPRERWPLAADILRLATLGGADVLGIAGGRIAEGAPADFVLFDLDDLDFCPLHDPINQLVTAVGTQSITDVMAAGRFLVRDRRLSSPVFADLPARAREAAFSLSNRTRNPRALAARLEPHVVAFATAQNTALPIARFIPSSSGPKT